MDSVLIRDETDADRARVFAVHAAAFPTQGEAKLVDQLRTDGDLVISVVGVLDTHIVGRAAFSRLHAPFLALGLGPVGVLPGQQRQGVGAALIRAGLERAGQQGWQGVFVLGDPPYYERFGFDCALAAGFMCRYAGPHFMALGLNGNALPQSQGEIAYPAAFDSRLKPGVRSVPARVRRGPGYAICVGAVMYGLLQVVVFAVGGSVLRTCGGNCLAMRIVRGNRRGHLDGRRRDSPSDEGRRRCAHRGCRNGTGHRLHRRGRRRRARARNVFICDR
jgi:putative acetyltransferase